MKTHLTTRLVVALFSFLLLTANAPAVDGNKDDRSFVDEAIGSLGAAVSFMEGLSAQPCVRVDPLEQTLMTMYEGQRTLDDLRWWLDVENNDLHTEKLVRDILTRRIKPEIARRILDYLGKTNVSWRVLKVSNAYAHMLSTGGSHDPRIAGRYLYKKGDQILDFIDIDLKRIEEQKSLALLPLYAVFRTRVKTALASLQATFPDTPTEFERHYLVFQKLWGEYRKLELAASRDRQQWIKKLETTADILEVAKEGLKAGAVGLAAVAGGPAGAAGMSGFLEAADSSASQGIIKGKIDPGKVAVKTVLGAVTAGAGAAASKGTAALATKVETVVAGRGAGTVVTAVTKKVTNVVADQAVDAGLTYASEFSQSIDKQIRETGTYDMAKAHEEATEALQKGFTTTKGIAQKAVNMGVAEGVDAAKKHLPGNHERD